MEEKSYLRKILCPFCNAVYTADMLHKLYFSEGSYTPGCVGSKIVSKIEIKCHRCQKTVYVKEIEEPIDYLDWENWSDSEWELYAKGKI